MPFCVLKDCFNESRKTKKEQGVTFHRFLQIGQEKREAWIKFVQKNRNEETWLPTEHTYICSLHFKDEDKYTTKTGRTYLKKSAVPYDYKIPLTHDEQSEFNEPISESVSDSESIFDTPNEIMLKKKLLKEIKARKTLAAKFKKAKRQNRYLKKKCEHYKKVVKILKEKSDFCTKNDSMA